MKRIVGILRLPLTLARELALMWLHIDPDVVGQLHLVWRRYGRAR